MWYRCAQEHVEDDDDPQWVKDQRARERQSAEYLRGLSGDEAHYHKRLADHGYEEAVDFDIPEHKVNNAYWMTPDGRTFEVDNHWDSARSILGLPDDGHGGYTYQPNITKHTLMKLARLVRVQTDGLELASEMVGQPTAKQLAALGEAEERLRRLRPRSRSTHEVNHAPEERAGSASSMSELEMLLDRLRRGKRRDMLPPGVYFEPPQ